MLVLIGVSFAFLVFMGFQIVQTPSWQSWLLASNAVILLILEFRALVLVRRGRHELGVWIVLAPLQLILIVIPFLVSGLGLVLLFSAIMVNILFADQTLPPRQARVLIFMGFVGGIAAFLVDLLIPIQRITLSGFQTFILIGIGILVVTYKKNSQLRDLTETLEKRVSARTEMLTAEVENRKLAEQTILRQNQLLTAAAEIASADHLHAGTEQVIGYFVRTHPGEVWLLSCFRVFGRARLEYSRAPRILRPGEPSSCWRASTGHWLEVADWDGDSHTPASRCDGRDE